MLYVKDSFILAIVLIHNIKQKNDWKKYSYNSLCARVKKNKNQDNKRLYARITVNGKRTEISTGRTMIKGVFNTKAQRCLGKTKEAQQINHFFKFIFVKDKWNKARACKQWLWCYS